MDMSDCRSWQVGLVGYGEVGRILAEDLRSQGVAVCAHDLKLRDAAAAPALRRHAAEHGVRLPGTHAELASQSDLVISAVTASQAVTVRCEVAAVSARKADFSSVERKELDFLVDRAADVVEAIVSEGVEWAQNKYHGN